MEKSFEVGDAATVKVGQLERIGAVTAIRNRDGEQLLTVTYRAKNGAVKVTHQLARWAVR